MTTNIKPLVAGNWKMNGFRIALDEIETIDKGYDFELQKKIDILICPPFTILHQAASLAVGSKIEIGGQDCHTNSVGAHTGDISAEMISDSGASFVIVGHSERRTNHKESNVTVKTKAEACFRAGLKPIICIGETKKERESGKTLEVLKEQLLGSIPSFNSEIELVVAYEPVWAIGTGLVPSVEDVEEAHRFIRQQLEGLYTDQALKIRILYGGSVKSSNAAELMSIDNVDGALVGGASLKAPDFLGICEAYKEIS